MVTHFIYTECQSPGPYKKEPGFKIKSAVASEFLSEVDVFDANSTKATLEKAVGQLAAYMPPEISPLASRLEFDSYPKSWVYVELPEELAVDEGIPAVRSFMFARMFTSGFAGGRPRNPFHEAYVFKSTDGKRVVDYCGEFTYPLLPRPIDLVCSSGWQNPKGDIELERVELSTTDIFEPQTFEARLQNNIRPLFLKNLDDTRWMLARFADALFDAKSFAIESTSIDEFYDWANLLFHLIQAPLTWRIDFSDTWSKPNATSSTGSLWRVFRGGGSQEVPSEDALALAEFVVTCFELGAELELFTAFDWLSERVVVDANNLAGSLPLLVLAFLMLDEQLFPEEHEDDDESALGLLHQLGVSVRWRSANAKQEVVQRIEEAQDIRLNDGQLANLLAWIVGR